MKCSLVFPAWDPRDIFSKYTVRNQVSFQHPNGLLYLAGMLIKSGHEVDFIDGAFLSHSQILTKIKDFEPDYIGIYASTPMWKKALCTTKDIKKINKKAHICIGGPYPIAMKTKCFDESHLIDSVCISEGEYVVSETVNRLQNNQSLSGISGLIYRDANGKVIDNGPGIPIENLDEIPFPPRYLLGDIHKYLSPPGTYKRKPIANIISSRGCTNLCLYCFQIYRDKTIRYRSAKNVVDELEECAERYGFKEVRFLDDQFTGDYDRVMEICQMIKDRKINLTWYASAIAGTVDKKLLGAMKSAGCWAILFGAESGVQKNLDTLKKGITLDQISSSVKLAKKAGIRPYTPFMFGIPGETFEDGLKTIEFACKINPYYVDFNSLTPFPGTTIYNDLDKYGTMLKDTDNFTFQHATFIPNTLTRDEIIKLRELAFKRFYSRWQFVLKRIFLIRGWSDIVTLFKGSKSLFWLYFGANVFNPSYFKDKKKSKDQDTEL